jgi:manganese/zinc/iron transport system permease protein
MYQFWIYIVVILLAIPSALLGSFLILRKSVMLSDAMSHSVVPGLVLGFLISKSLYSPCILVMATIFGVLTVYGVEWINFNNKVKKDASIGLVFTFLFAVGILLISNFTSSNTDLDQECILYGDLGASPLNRFRIQNVDLGPKALWTLLILNLLVFGFLKIFWRPMICTTFDPTFSETIGYKPKKIHFYFMTLLSFCIVSAFDIVGAILIISLLAIPAACSYLFAKNSFKLLIISTLTSILASVFGVFIAFKYNLVLSATISLAMGLIFLVIFIQKRIVWQKH